jgi:hypothetical protein
MARTPDEKDPRERVLAVRVGPTDEKIAERRRKERGNLSVSAYIRTLIREDGERK